jgi:hypothetical protein
MATRPTRLHVSDHRVLAVVVAAIVAIGWYALDRSMAVWMHGPPQPLSANASARIDYFWRMGISAVLASMAWWAVELGHRHVRATHMPVAIHILLGVTLVASIMSCLWP